MPTRPHSFLRLLPVASLMLAACTVNTPSGPAKSQTSPEWRQHQQSVSTISRYQTRGSFAYLSDKQKVYARFNWQQTTAERYRLLLTNPLGSTEMDLNVQPGAAQITNNQGKKYISDDPQEMIEKLTGMSIPLTNLRQWMLGLPGDATDFTLDDKGYLKQVNYRQDGQQWTVTYQGYHSDLKPALPANMELRQGGQRIKLKMDNWIL
ncbi:lipoprotein insertase outer membrane protein LolB [Biostraticola tofi]|uniref:Outer-membrane lipoprotein LolB n=1 Tax=Biostraticola tofi TaxID=466109 RepID=A0A4R3Z3R0_9GAMM|nr:lipoprotein insertase outer membrane protein LolB [Biostraticola tofi]TCV99688.1 outer membrane lipoprotein LolB [Biostraticola tofi]